PEEMAAALARHDEILRDAITSAGGRVLKTTGDGAIAVFESSADGIRASITAQQALGAEPWENARVRVRMGLHAGETLSRDEDHFGPVMNRAARIMAAGHGGQVLVSETAVHLAADGLAPETGFRDLGRHRLKDLTEPEHLFQLLHPGLPATFPDLKTLDARPNNLPLQATELVGRTQELAAIHLMLGSPAARLLTIAGPGGAGKTRLGLQVGADLIDSYRDGVWFVDLTADNSPADAFETVVRTLELPVSRTGEPLDVLKNRLRDRQMLLILDNFEQVVDAGSGVGELLAAAPELRVVITSRETLRVRGEQVYPVPPLALPHPDRSLGEIAESEAVRLFVERASEASPAFALDDGNARDVAAICLRLDGLPLAIELAAARLNVFTPSDLLDRITDRLDVLASGGRDLPDRQRTLWGAISWSYELLNEDERRLFELLSVFSSADLPALETVAANASGDGFIVDTLASLVDKSLVRRIETDGSYRFSMLQMIKEYAAGRLAGNSGEHAGVIAAHATYYSTLAALQQSDLDAAGRDRALTVLEADLDNLRAAWHFWVEQSDYPRLAAMFPGMWALHSARGWYHGAIALADDLLGILATTEASEERDSAEQALRVNQARALMAVHGYNLGVESAFQRALELAGSIGTSRDEAPVLRALASYYTQTADFPKAAELALRLLEIGDQLGDEALQIEARSALAATLLYFDIPGCLAHLDFVIAHYDPARHGSHRLGPDSGVVARISKAVMLWETGHAEAVVQLANEALEFADRIGHPFSRAWALYHCGFLAAIGGRWDEVRSLSERLAAISSEHDYPLWRTLATVLEGVARTALGEPEIGVKLTESGVELYEGLAPPPVFWPFVLGLRASVYAMAEDPAAALELVDQAIAIWEPGGVVPPELWVRRADLLRMIHGPTDEVEELYERGATVAAGLDMARWELRARTRLVALRREQRPGDDGLTELAELVATLAEGHDDDDYRAAQELLGT
ncbi:MAG: AAA family ATPase, partial [Acidimicrobiia bacterium]|nr:AAA family ATPase [Acidimicrobiia bacterium]